MVHCLDYSYTCGVGGEKENGSGELAEQDSEQESSGGGVGLVTPD